MIATNPAQQTDSSASKRYFVIGLGVVLVAEVLLRDVFLTSESTGNYIAFAVGVELLLTLVFAFVWIPRVEHQGASSIGLTKPRWRHLWLGVVVFIAQLVVSVGIAFGLKAAGLGTLEELQPTLVGYGVLALASLFVAGFAEELFYRGYLIERVTALTGKPWIAYSLSWLSFTLIHLRFFGLGPTIQVGVLSASLVWVYRKEASLWPCMVVHGINSLFAYVLFPALA